MLNLTEFGADSTGTTLCTGVIQAAIDRLAGEGGGTLCVPPGIYLTGTILLRSNCTLLLEAGATLLASTNLADYRCSRREVYWLGTCGSPAWKQYFALILADDAENVAITGQGVIDGRGKFGEYFPNADDPEQIRPFLALFYHCFGVTLSGVTLKDSAAYAFLGIDSENVRLTGLKVRTFDSGNGDGLDFDGGRNIVISDCLLETGDDSISLKTTDLVPLVNVTVTNCIMKSRWAAVRIGIESSADIRNVEIGNCVFSECRDGIKVQNCGGAVYENIRFHDIVMEDVLRPVFVTLNRFRFSFRERGVRPLPGSIRNLTIAGISCSVPEGAGGFDRPGCVVSGIPGTRIEGLVIRDFRAVFHRSYRGSAEIVVPELLDFSERYPEIDNFGAELPCAGLFLRHVADADLSGVRLTFAGGDSRPAIFCRDAEFSVSDVRCSGTDAFREIGPEFEKALGHAEETAALADAKLEERAKRIETAISFPVLRRLDFERDDAGFWVRGERKSREKWLVLLRLRGNFEAFCGDFAERIEMPPEYCFFAPYAVDLDLLPKQFALRFDWIGSGELCGRPEITGDK